tara:strand:- start:1936 stop:2667 length:732 start_codon:yes stop_codon:yes gene_type:complete
MAESFPNVCILVPTFNRPEWLPLLINNLKTQTYPHEKLTCLIMDDGSKPFIEDVENVREQIKPIQLEYYKCDTWMEIGKKRNELCKKALKIMGKKGIVCNMDDDDFFVPDYVMYSVSMLTKSNKTQIVGSNQMQFMFPFNDWKMSGMQCQAKRQIHESCLTMRLSHWKRMGGYGLNSQGEGSKLFDGVDQSSIELLDIRMLMICIGHKTNTIPKDQFFTDETSLQMIFDMPGTKDIIKDILKM